MGSALAAALAEALVTVDGPFGRGFDGTQASGRSDRSGATKGHYDIVLLAVPDAQIATAASTIVAGPLVGHCAGSMGLDVLGDRESFSIHPLMTVIAEGAEFTGAGAAVAGSTGRALMVARDIALALGMSPVEISECDRAAYHAAASIASNFLAPWKTRRSDSSRPRGPTERSSYPWCGRPSRTGQRSAARLR